MIDIVIVNWNSGTHLGRCTAALARADRECSLVSQVFVVDNHSSDGSTREIDSCGGKLVLIENARNEGFATASNQGARLGRAELILFLNPDAEVTASALRLGAEAFVTAEPVPSAIGVQLRSESGAVTPSCSRFPTVKNLVARATGLDKLLPSHFRSPRMLEWSHVETQQVDQIMGAFFLVRRSDFQQIGGFDERFFVYFEEVDYCRRWAEQGRRALFLAEASVLHHGRGTTRQVPATALFYSLRSRIQYSRKHFGPAEAATVIGATIAVEPIARAAEAIGRKDMESFKGLFKTYRLLYSWLMAGLPVHSREVE